MIAELRRKHRNRTPFLFGIGILAALLSIWIPSQAGKQASAKSNRHSTEESFQPLGSLPELTVMPISSTPVVKGDGPSPSNAWRLHYLGTTYPIPETLLYLTKEKPEEDYPMPNHALFLGTLRQVANSPTYVETTTSNRWLVAFSPTSDTITDAGLIQP